MIRIGDDRLNAEAFRVRAAKLLQTGFRHVTRLDDETRRQLAEAVIARELLVREGLRRGLDQEPEIAAEVSDTEARLLGDRLYEQEALTDVPVPNRDEVLAFAREHELDVEVLSLQVVCASEAQAEDALAEARRGAPWDSLARAYSNPSVLRRFGRDGNIGWFRIGHLLRGLKDPLRTLDPGELYPGIVRTRLGYHVFRLVERRAVDEEALIEQVGKHLQLQYRADAMAAYVERLRQTYGLTWHPESLATLCALPAEEKEGSEALVLLSWDGGRLTAADFMDTHRRGRSRHPSSLDPEELGQAAETLAGRRILAAEARRLGLDRHPDVVASILRRRDELLVQELFEAEGRAAARARPVTEEEVRAFYEANPERYTTEDGQVTAYALVRDGIGTMLLEQRQSRSMDSFISGLRQGVEVAVDAEALRRVELELPPR
ncbi:MAG: peptidylprolyl isomerase [bacterium]|nr:peptidylprolyl isomerase [bacterium]